MTQRKQRLLGELKTIRWQNFLGLTIAGIINSIGVTLFLAPVNLIDSGFSGTSLFLSQLLGDVSPLFTLSFFLILLNFPFFLFGLKKQGAVFTIYSLYAIVVYSVVSLLIQHVLPIDFSGGSPIAQNELLLCALFGGLVSGIGSGLTIRFGGAIDGVEVMAVIFAKFLGLTIGTFVMIYCAILYVIAGSVAATMGAAQAWLIPLYSIIAYAVGNKAVDFVVEGFDKAKAAMIISNDGPKIAQRLSSELKRGITMLHAHGYYSQEEKTVLYVVVNRFQIGKLKRLVSETDPMAFVTITDISDSLGTSLKFSLRRKKKAVPLPVVHNSDAAVTLLQTQNENRSALDTPDESED